MAQLSYHEVRKIKDIAQRFCIHDGEITHVLPISVGKVNATYKVTVTYEDDTMSYMLQKINTKIFKDPELVVSNAIKVSEHLRNNGHDSLEFVYTKSNNRPLYKDKTGIYRMTKFIHAEVFQGITRPMDMQMLGYAVGDFIIGVSDLDCRDFVDTIPNFHNTKIRFDDLLLSALKCILRDEKRVKPTCEDLEYVIENRDVVGIIVDALLSNQIPIRIIHNDTKLSNVLFDRKTNTPRCMIDLDTVMKGSALYDIADAIRSGANTYAGEEKEFLKVEIDLELMREFLVGFVNGAPGLLTEKEIELLPIAIKIIPLELGMRYLTDYYDGNKYFNASYKEQNLYRARAQFAFAKDVDKKMSDIVRIVNDVIQ